MTDDRAQFLMVLVVALQLTLTQMQMLPSCAVPMLPMLVPMMLLIHVMGMGMGIENMLHCLILPPLPRAATVHSATPLVEDKLYCLRLKL